MKSLHLSPISSAIAALLLGAALSPSLHAQNAASPPDNTLRGVVVSASRSQATIEEMPLHTTVLTQEEIQRSPAQTLDQLLRNVPGLNFSGVPSPQSDPTGQQTKMRGLGNAKVLVLLDGVPIMDPFYLTTQWFKVPLSNIERVEIVRGGNSSLWGNMAVAGVINVVSKQPRDNSGEASVSVGSRSSSNFSLSKNFAVTDALGLNLSVDQLNSKGYQIAPADQQWRFAGKGPANAKDTHIQLSAYFAPAPDLKGYVRLGASVQDQNISYEFGNNRQVSPDLSGSLTQKIDDKSRVTATAWAQYVSFDKFNGAGCYWQANSSTKCPAVASVTATQVNTQVAQYYTQSGVQRYHEQGASALYARELGKVWQNLQVGLDYRRLSATDFEQFYATPTSLNQLQSFNSSTYGTGAQTFAGLFAQTKIVPTPMLEVTLSGRYDSWNNDDRVNTRTTAAGALTGGAQSSSNKSAFNPSAALRYNLNDDLSVRAAAYKSFRAPGFNNTTRTYGSPNPTIANPGLGPENLWGREWGLDYTNADLSVGATYFHYDIKNMIATYKVTSANAPSLVQTLCGGPTLGYCGGTASYYTNDQDGQSNGLEVTARWRASPNLQLDASYTHTRSVLTRKGYVSNDPTGVQLAGLPKDVFNLGLAWQPSSRLRTYLQMHFIGSMFIDTTTVLGQYVRQGSVTVIDASAAYALGKDTDLTLSIQNLFNRAYSENAYTYNQPWNRTLSLPLTVFAGVKYRF
jgi:iron complex outermembrane receptor protein